MIQFLVKLVRGKTPMKATKIKEGRLRIVQERQKNTECLSCIHPMCSLRTRLKVALMDRKKFLLPQHKKHWKVFIASEELKPTVHSNSTSHQLLSTFNLLKS